MLISTAEEMNPTRRNTMEDVHVIHAPQSWGAPHPSASFIGIYDGHGGRLIVDYLEDHLARNVAQEWTFEMKGEGKNEVAAVAAGRKRRLPRSDGNDDSSDDDSDEEEEKEKDDGEIIRTSL